MQSYTIKNLWRLSFASLHPLIRLWMNPKVLNMVTLAVQEVGSISEFAPVPNFLLMYRKLAQSFIQSPATALSLGKYVTERVMTIITTPDEGLGCLLEVSS